MLVFKCIAALSKVSDTRTDLFRKRNEKLHSSQRVLLGAIYILYSEIDEDKKSSRDYIQQLPPDDQRELTGGFSENIYFASQALSSGYRIRGIEQYTSELLQPARHVTAAMGAVRHVLRERVLRDPMPPHRDLFPVLQDFDLAWATFEKKICFYYFAATYHGIPGRIDETHLFQVLMSETVLRALDRGYITVDQVQSFDPSLILAIPRLTLFSALHHTPDMVNVTDPQNAFRWFRSQSSLLFEVKMRILELKENQINHLERILADQPESEGDVTVGVEDEAVKSIFLDICSVSDQLIRSKEVIGMLSKVFSMHKEEENTHIE
ncbi:hypothetical protein HDU79_008340 [Rhizoclosmatium sp. JEL0117]|nr:hypothetical protein HDU79_008340 [Rhizoclosmatium sp. JEL0117]